MRGDERADPFGVRLPGHRIRSARPYEFEEVFWSADEERRQRHGYDIRSGSVGQIDLHGHAAPFAWRVVRADHAAAVGEAHVSPPRWTGEMGTTRQANRVGRRREGAGAQRSLGVQCPKI